MNLRQKPNGIWVVDFDDAESGKRRRVSTGTKDKRDAQARAREIIHGIDVRPAPADLGPKPGSAEAGGLTMDQLFDLCCKGDGPWTARRARSQSTIKSNLNKLAPLVGNKLVSEITHAVLKEVRDKMLDEGLAPGTVKRRLDAIGRALRHAEEEGLLSFRPKMPSVVVDNLSDRILEEPEEVAVFAAIAKRIKDEPARQWVLFGHLCRFLLDTGCRLNEPLQSAPEWVKQHQGRPVFEIPAWATKTGKGRTIPLSQAIVEALPYLRITAVEDRLFRMLPATAWYMWDTIREDVRQQTKLNIDDVKLHTFRHTCLTRLLRGGLPLHKVSKWAGHADIKITMQRYAKIDTTDLLDGLDILDAVPLPAARLKAV